MGSWLTKILPVVVCPEISSPAQSLASVMKVPSNSCLPWRAAFCSFCFGSLGENSGSLRQQRNANTLQRSTINSPAKKVNMLDSKKHHHLRSLRHSAFGAGLLETTSLHSSQHDIPTAHYSHSAIRPLALQQKTRQSILAGRSKARAHLTSPAALATADCGQ